MDDESVAYVGIGLKLHCPAPVGGQIVSTLLRLGDDIEYQPYGSGAPGLPWPPDATAVQYGERCFCPTCEGRLVGDFVETLRDVLEENNDDLTVNEDTHFCQYLESARDLVVRESQLYRYSIHRDTSTFTDTYVRAARRVAVRYDRSFQEVEDVKVDLPETGEAYPSTISGAVAALRGSAI